MIFIFRPFEGIVGDIVADVIEVIFVTDDVFVIIALPERQARSVAKKIEAFGGNGFEGTD